MPIDQAKFQKIKDRVTKDIQDAVADLKDVIAAAKETFDNLKTEVPPDELADIILTVALPYLHLPWYVPNFVVKAALVKTITDLEAKV